MYALIIAIHAVFVTLSYFLGYSIFTGIFVILGIFFLFYFSPLFFLDEDKKDKEGFRLALLSTPFSQFSPKDSLLLPTILLYIALYGFSFATFGASYDPLLLHTLIVAGIYLLFLGYMLAFYWKHDIFFEVFRFHTLFTLVSTVIFSLSFFLSGKSLSLLHIFIGVLGILAGTFLLSFTKKESSLFLSGYLFALYSTTFLLVSPFFPASSLIALTLSFTALSILLFEVLPLSRFFTPYTDFFRYFSLFVSIGLTPILLFRVFSTVESISTSLLMILTLFFLSIHTRYRNYVVFLLSIINTYSLYFVIFSDLILDPSMTSAFLFTFFLPLLIIGTTYFWEENHPYDFMILHYSSILFAVISSIYIIFFIGWGGDLLFVTSLCIFGLALLFFLSYFRFRSARQSLT